MIASRIDEIRNNLHDKDLSRATRRMLDLFIDYSLTRTLKQEAVALRAAYNEYAASGQAQASDAKHVELQQKATQILEKIEAELLPQSPEPASQAATPTPDPVATPYSRTIGNVVFRAEGITKNFSNSSHSFRLPPVDIDLKLGEITGIVGENGNGKTTLLRMIAGDLESDGGRLFYPQFEANPGDWYQIRHNIAYIQQHVPKWSGFLKTNLHFNAALHGLKGEENEEQVNFIIHRLGLSKYENALWSEVSGGYKLRFELARALVWRPRLLVIDEPLAHLDINAQQVFMQDLRYLASSSKHPMAVLISSQHLHEVESIADNILFIKNGELLYNGSMREFGSDRNENLFEFATTATKSEMLAALAGIEGISIEDGGQQKVVHTPIDVNMQQVMGALVLANIPITYFRDISTSTLKLFREQAQNRQ